MKIPFPPVPDDLDYEDSDALEAWFRNFFATLPEDAHQRYEVRYSRPQIVLESEDDPEGGTALGARCNRCKSAYLFRAAELEAKFPALAQRTPPAAIAGKDIGVWLGNST